MSANFRDRFARSRRRSVPQVARFLIVSEGKETEPNYFKQFATYVKPVIKTVGTGANTLDVVKLAIAQRRRVQRDPEKRYDQVWCVFDRDEFPADRFAAALKLAQQNQIQVAYSIESFELWILLHFGLVNAQIGRAAYLDKITIQFRKLGYGDYAKNDPGLYAKLIDFQPVAIANAQKLSERYQHVPNVLDHDPETTVYRLVIALNQQGKARLR